MRFIHNPHQGRQPSMNNNLQPPLWQPSETQIAPTNISKFSRDLNLPNDYFELHKWSVKNKDLFWQAVWKHCGVVGDMGSDRILIDAEKMPGATFFPDAKLNFAENLLKHRGSNTAIISCYENGKRNSVSRDELLENVHSLTEAFKGFKLQQGDRVAALCRTSVKLSPQCWRRLP